MKKLLLKMSGIALATAALAIGSASTARADERIVARVPFAFMVGDMQLPAGNYVVKETAQPTFTGGNNQQYPYLDGLESPADGSNIIRGLIARGYDDSAIRKIAGQNAMDFFRRTMG